MVAGLPQIVFPISAAELSKPWERVCYCATPPLNTCAPTAQVRYIEMSVFCLPGQKTPL